MGFQDVRFLPSQASFPPHFLKTVVGFSKGMLPDKYLRSKKLLLMSVVFHGEHKTVIKLR